MPPDTVPVLYLQCFITFCSLAARVDGGHLHAGVQGGDDRASYPVPHGPAQPQVYWGQGQTQPHGARRVPTHPQQVRLPHRRRARASGEYSWMTEWKFI
jgi:hypothetical protein